MAAPETSPKLLKANRTRILLLTLGSFAFVVGSLLLPDATPAEQLLKYGGAAFFLLCGAAAASHLLPGRSGLSIDAEGMELSDGFKGRRRIAFADIAEKGFFVYSMKGASMVTGPTRRARSRKACGDGRTRPSPGETITCPSITRATPPRRWPSFSTRIWRPGAGDGLTPPFWTVPPARGKSRRSLS